MIFAYFVRNVLCKTHKTVIQHARLMSATTVDDVSWTSNNDDHKYQELLQELYHAGIIGQRLFLIQPKVRNRALRRCNTSSELMLNEAVALAETLQNWSVVSKLIVPVQSLKKQHIFGSGKMEELALIIRQNPEFSAVFVNVAMLTSNQHADLYLAWRLPIYDRYNIVLHIFKMYAKTEEAKLQIGLAEIPYLRARLRNLFKGNMHMQDLAGMNFAGGIGQTFWQKQSALLNAREQKIRHQLGEVRKQRDVIRLQRQMKAPHPVVAVIGYTNTGKTSLIRCLTQDTSVTPEDRLFATLDVTTHIGLTPSRMRVCYMDTVGFISDLPIKLIASFSATLDDIKHADMLIHVRDISHPDTLAQKDEVLRTLKDLSVPEPLISNMIEVCNKCDLMKGNLTISDEPKPLLVSCTNNTGLWELNSLVEKRILSMGRMLSKKFQIPMTAQQPLSFLYRHASVEQVLATEEGHHLIVSVSIDRQSLQKFEAHYGSDLEIA